MVHVWSNFENEQFNLISICVIYICIYILFLWVGFFFLGGYPSLQNTVQVTVNIVDLNDNSPIITPNSYVASVRENLPSGQSVLRVSTLRPQTYDSKMSVAIEVPVGQMIMQTITAHFRIPVPSLAIIYLFQITEYRPASSLLYG